jgi:CBS domain containing-hemolysin-like protein
MSILSRQMIAPRQWSARAAARVGVRVAVAAACLSVPRHAHASLLSPELEDKLATFLAVFILFVVPIVLIVVFWLVHILPEKIAHKRHHPQFEAIRTLCLLSLVFGGLLWPLAWIWAYSRPVMHKLAYGTDKHPDALEHETGHSAGDDSGTADIRERLARLEERGVPASELKALRADLEALEAKFAGDEAR